VIGFSRAMVAGHHIAVAGTAPIMPNDGAPPTDAYGQAVRCFEIVLAALREAGAGPEHVVRTRTYLVDAQRARRSVERTGRCSATFVRRAR
jgi:enamine deaminase RidA (YjgF/YER057c/UK114 family)